MSNLNENKMSFNWYPGHMEKTKRKIKEIEGLIDIVLELADARIPITSRLNREFLKNKDSILILTKYDLCDKEKTDKLVEELKKTYKDVICTYIGDKTIKSKIKNIAENILKEKIEKRENKGLIKRKIRAIVVGIPNVGKSTLINTLCGKTVAKAENRPGVTRSLEWLKISPDFEFIDSPGILGKKFSSQDEAFRLASLSSVNEAILNYQDLAIFIYEELRDKYPSRFLEFYKIDGFTDFLTDIEKRSYSSIFARLEYDRRILFYHSESPIHSSEKTGASLTSAVISSRVAAISSGERTLVSGFARREPTYAMSSSRRPRVVGLEVDRRRACRKRPAFMVGIFPSFARMPISPIALAASNTSMPGPAEASTRLVSVPPQRTEAPWSARARASTSAFFRTCAA